MLEKNFRPVQSLDGRTILSSFEMASPTPSTHAMTVTAGTSGLYPRWILTALIATVVIMLNYS